MTGLGALAAGWVTLSERLADAVRDPEALVLAYEDALRLPEWHPDRESLVRCLRWRVRTARTPDGGYAWQPAGPFGLARVEPGDVVLAAALRRGGSPFPMPALDEVTRW